MIMISFRLSLPFLFFSLTSIFLSLWIFPNISALRRKRTKVLRCDVLSSEYWAPSFITSCIFICRICSSTNNNRMTFNWFYCIRLGKLWIFFVCMRCCRVSTTTASATFYIRSAHITTLLFWKFNGIRRFHRIMSISCASLIQCEQKKVPTRNNNNNKNEKKRRRKKKGVGKGKGVTENLKTITL